MTRPEVLERNYRMVASHLLFKQRAILTIFESRFLSRRPFLSFLKQSPHRKMFRSDKLEPSDVDNLYSELVCVELPDGSDG